MSRLLHALDLASMRNFDAAKLELEGIHDPVADRLFLLVSELEQHEAAERRGLATIRHEIGNALAIAQANLEGISDGVLAPTSERIAGILSSLQSTSRLLEDLRRIPEQSQQETIVLETFNLCALIASNASAIDGLAQAKNVQLRYDPCGAEIASCEYYHGDAARIGQILRNVLINAVRYTPPGGHIEIHCGKQNGEVAITVQDSGSGIADDDLPHVFEAGYRGKNIKQQKGSGVGLSVVRALITAIAGDIGVTSNENGGATFIVTLPAAPLTV